jgi:hypothetical protein
MNTHFRRLRSAKVGDRQLALATVAQIWELTFALERHVRLPDADLPALEGHVSPVEAAKRLREHWGIGRGPVRHLVATAEAHGVVVAIRPVGAIEAVDAFSVVVLDRPIVVTTPRRRDAAPAPARADQLIPGRAADAVEGGPRTGGATWRGNSDTRSGAALARKPDQGSPRDR